MLLSYVVFLGIIGSLMLTNVRTIIRSRKRVPFAKLHQHSWLHGLPLKMRFRRSKLCNCASALLLGAFVGVLAAIMGVGGGFIMVPAMIYLLGMPTSVVVGTSLFQIIFVTANVTLLQSIQTQTVDFCSRPFAVRRCRSARLAARPARCCAATASPACALVVLAVCIKIGYDLGRAGAAVGGAAMTRLASITGCLLAATTLVTNFAAGAAPTRLVADLSQSRVDITGGYHGTELLLFGAYEGVPGDELVLIVEGRQATSSSGARKKAGVWVNVETLLWKQAPSSTICSRPPNLTRLPTRNRASRRISGRLQAGLRW